MMTLETLSRSFTRRNLVRGLLWIAAAICLSGCGGASNFTGGGFPIGKAAVLGRVVDAQNPSVSLANVRLTLFSTPAEGDTRILRTTTDERGNYNFAEVPTGEFGAPVQVSVEPATPSYQSQAVTFQIYNGRTADLVVALPHESFDTTQGKTIAITPSTDTLQPGATVRYIARVFDANGKALPITPTLLLSDALGTISPNGSFTGTTTGTGTVTAIWYNNLRATASVIVDTNAPQLPPAPPEGDIPVSRASHGQPNGVKVGGAVKVGGDLYGVGQDSTRHNP